jgi:carbamoyl-phosphate synthase large subunit
VSAPSNGAARPTSAIVNDETLRRKLIIPNSERIHYLHAAFERDWPLDEIQELTGIDPWFLTQLRQIVDLQNELQQFSPASLPTRPPPPGEAVRIL